MSGLLEVELLLRKDGALCEAYVKLAEGEVAETRVIKPDVVLADFDKNGVLLGIDILAATDVKVIVGLVKNPAERAVIQKLAKERLSGLLEAA